MTIKLSDYGVRGPWATGDCDSCGKRRSCLQSRIPDGPDGWDYYYLCVPCLIKDIETYEKQREELGM